MDAPHTRTTSAYYLWLFNPFHFLAGGQALAWGLACIALTAWLGGIFDFRFTGVISFQRTAPAPLWHAIAQGLMAWAIPSVLLYIGGRLISRSRVRPIDVFGTQALARVPGLLIALIVVSPPFRDLTTSLIAQGISHLSIAQLALLTSVAIVLILLLVWMVFLMYRAFAVSCNVAGGRAIAVFIAACRPRRGRHRSGGTPAAGDRNPRDRCQRTRPVRTTPSGCTTGHRDPPSSRTGSL